MTITYEVGNSLYVNLTNKCTNNCDFCIRKLGAGAYGSDSLWLEREPTEEEAYTDIIGRNLAKYKELVFCGYGEPTERVDTLLEVAAAVKRLRDIPVRINTNGQGNLINGRDVTPEFEGLVDVVSVSLNCASAEEYERVCRPRFGRAAYDAVLEFARLCVKHVKRTVLSVVDTTIPPEDIEKCRALAAGMGAEFRLRPFE